MSRVHELTTIHQVNQPCCVCYVQKKSKTIIEYRCMRCNEGIVCMECAEKLSVSYAKNKCPICMHSPDSPDTWYQSYDVEMGYIRPPSIEYAQETEYNNYNCTQTSIMQWIAEFICCILASCALGTTIKIAFGICYYNCSYEPPVITIITSIGVGIIAFLVLLMVGTGIISIFGLFLECIIMTSGKICEYINYYYENNETPLDIICKRNIKYVIVCVCYLAITLLLSFFSGTLFKMSCNKCYWGCENETQLYTIFTSIMVGIAVLLLISVFALIAFTIIAVLFIICFASSHSSDHR